LPFGNYPSHVNKIVTIHDVIFKSHPQNYSFIDRSIYHIKTKHAASVADTVIATSKFTAQQIQLYYPIEPSKIKVVYQACNEIFIQAVPSSRVQAFKEKYKLDNPFFLYVSSFNQRKNHLFLLKTFKKYPNPNHHLVLAGSLGDSFEAVNKLIADLDLSKRVTILPNVEQHELTVLYHAASWFVYPSIQEGFGIPLLEAMTCHLPILASNIPVFKEIASNEVLFYDLQKEEELLNQLITLSEIDKIDYSSHIQQYSKESIAKQLMTIYQG
jgi:glycosyltransferase involved in cell wall biosynthesis